MQLCSCRKLQQLNKEEDRNEDEEEEVKEDVKEGLQEQKQHIEKDHVSIMAILSLTIALQGRKACRLSL